MNYVRRPATVEVLFCIIGRTLQPSSNVYTYNDGDTVVIVVLTLQRGREVNVKEEDIAIYQMLIHEIE